MSVTGSATPDGFYDCLCSGRWHAGHVGVRFDQAKGACRFDGLGTWHEGLPGDRAAWGQCIMDKRYPSGQTLGDIVADAVAKHFEAAKTKPRPAPPAAGCEPSDESFVDHYDGETQQEAEASATQLAQLQVALDAHVRRLAKEGYYIANKTEAQKVMNLFWHAGAKTTQGAVNTLLCVLNGMPKRAYDRPGTEAIPDHTKVKGPAPQIELDKGWSQCEQAAELSRGSFEAQVRAIVGPDALISTISITHAGISNFNHIANLVVLPNGQRFVIDAWASLAEGAPRIYREDKWLRKWRCDTWVGGGGAAGTVVTYGAMASSDSAVVGGLERHKRAGGGFDFDKFRAEQPQKDKKRAETLIRSVQKFPVDTQPAPILGGSGGSSQTEPSRDVGGPDTKPGWSRGRD